jgi:CRISPR/Cas system endoribonuclease Cas6 (RAMP superfamily)
MYFVALLLTVRRIEEARPPESRETRDIHHVLTDYHRSLAASHQQQYGITVSLLRCETQYALLRLTICSREKTPVSAILETVLSSLFGYGRGLYEVQAIDLTNPRWAGISTWADLLAQQTERFMHFSFATPLITAEPDRQQNRNVLPFPEPLPLFSSLAQRWQTLGGPTLAGSADQLIRASACVVSKYRLCSLTREGSVPAPVGYLGWIEYECLRYNQAIVSLNALARLAFFTGTGYLTAYGMGSTTTRLSS